MRNHKIWKAVLLLSGLFLSVSYGQGSVPPGVLFYDDFEYVVGREDSTAPELFRTLGGWNGAKTYQAGRTGAKGYVYTVDAIPGYTGQFPGINSDHVVCLEARSNLFQGQTDFYLQYGGAEDSIGHIPANHWYQFWVYLNHYGEQQSLISSGKFIYPNRATYYPATLSNEGYVYLITLIKGSHVPLNLDPCPGGTTVGCDSSFFAAIWNNEHNGINNYYEYNNWKFGANISDQVHFPANQWTLVKIHVDISGTDPRAAAGQAVYEMWIRRLGDSSWTKTAEYFGGVTESNGEILEFTPAYTDGLRMFRMPTTIGATTDAKGDWFDYWLYLDDFALAESEDALPQYEDQISVEQAALRVQDHAVGNIPVRVVNIQGKVVWQGSLPASGQSDRFIRAQLSAKGSTGNGIYFMQPCLEKHRKLTRRVLFIH